MKLFCFRFYRCYFNQQSSSGINIKQIGMYLKACRRDVFRYAPLPGGNERSVFHRRYDMRSLRWLMSVAVAGACILGLLSGCSKAPDQELAAAKAAVKAAQDAEADKYMSNNFQNLQKALSSAEAEIERQNQAFALSRKYTKANALLKNVLDLATQITAEAPKAKDNLKTQIEKALGSSQQVITATRTEIKNARRSMSKDVFTQMTAKLDAADGACAKAAADFKAGNILDAEKNLAEVQKLLKAVSDRLSSGGMDGLM